MKRRSTAPMMTAKIGYIVMSALTVAAGIAFVAFPVSALRTLTRALGAIAVLFGAVKIIGYFSKDLYRLAFQFDLEFGVVMIAAGAVMMLHPSFSITMLATAVGLLTVFDGLFKARIALDAKRFGLPLWWVITALGMISFAAGLALVIRPAESVAVMSAILGATLICDGALNFAVALEAVKIVKNQYPDIIDPEYDEKEDIDK